MADIFTPEKRSEVMSRIRGRDTKPELMVRSMLHRHGYRFTVNGPKNKKLPGRPDIVLPKHKAVIFVHGCFWHGHEGCGDFRMPKSRTEFWENKISNNKARDRRNLGTLHLSGWKVITIWACEMKTISAKSALYKRLPALIELRQMRYHFEENDPLPMAAEEEAEYRVAEQK